MIYTSEQLASMTQNQLMGIVLESQVSAASTTETVLNSTDGETAVTVEAAKTDTEKAIEQVEAAITNLETSGAELFQSEIANLKEKLTNLKNKAIEEAQIIEAEIATAETELSSFWLKYRVEIIVAVLLIVSHIATKVGF